MRARTGWAASRDPIPTSVLFSRLAQSPRLSVLATKTVGLPFSGDLGTNGVIRRDAGVPEKAEQYG